VDVAAAPSLLCWGMAADTLPRADYADTFSVSNTEFHTAEEWARAAFRTGSLRESKQLVWRRALQLRLGPLDDPGRVAGWAVAENRPERLVLAADSWHFVARLVFDADPDRARVTTRVTYRHPAGRLVWAAVAPLHRRAVPDILAAAANRLTRSIDRWGPDPTDRPAGTPDGHFRRRWCPGTTPPSPAGCSGATGGTGSGSGT
jgi:hypothetical protein